MWNVGGSYPVWMSHGDRVTQLPSGFTVKATSENAPFAIATDGSGVYVTGYTASPNFPTMDPLQPANDGGGDAFVAKLNATGSALV